MLYNESWLVHSDVFDKHWKIELKPWIRNLGWFTDFMETVVSAKGWVQAGEKELSVHDYINLIEEKDSQKKMFCYKEGKWEHMEGPVIFTVKHDEEQVFIAGWMGDEKMIQKMKKESADPWEWSKKNIIEVDPVIALHTVRGVKGVKKPEDDAIPVFFTSNGESNADKNWEHLVNLCPRAVRIDGIDGRRKMFHRCVDLSRGARNFFVVTGKNFITDRTVFDYPISKPSKEHVVFRAKNMSNRLEYGHMGVVCYNTDLVLNTPEDFGLDFTEYSPIHSVPRTVSEATFATTPYEAWRTAFREAVKLTLRGTIESEHWLARWLAFAEGVESGWVIKGAEQGHAYALENINAPEHLRKSEDWNWLKARFDAL